MDDEVLRALTTFANDEGIPVKETDIPYPGKWFKRKGTSICGITKAGVEALTEMHINWLFLPEMIGSYTIDTIDHSLFRQINNELSWISGLCAGISQNIEDVYPYSSSSKTAQYVSITKLALYGPGTLDLHGSTWSSWQSNINPIIESFNVLGNSDYCTIDGVLFNEECTTILAYPCGKKDEMYVIPDTVEKIERKAFLDTPALKKVICYKPDTVDESDFCGAHIEELTVPPSRRDLAAEYEQQQNELNQSLRELLDGTKKDVSLFDIGTYIERIDDDLPKKMLPFLKEFENDPTWWLLTAGKIARILCKFPFTADSYDVYHYMAMHNIAGANVRGDYTISSLMHDAWSEAKQRLAFYSACAFSSGECEADIMERTCVIVGLDAAYSEEKKEWLFDQINNLIAAGYKHFISDVGQELWTRVYCRWVPVIQIFTVKDKETPIIDNSIRKVTSGEHFVGKYKPTQYGLHNREDLQCQVQIEMKYPAQLLSGKHDTDEDLMKYEWLFFRSRCLVVLNQDARSQKILTLARESKEIKCIVYDDNTQIGGTSK